MVSLPRILTGSGTTFKLSSNWIAFAEKSALVGRCLQCLFGVAIWTADVFWFGS